ncbi:MAG TPA: hypothetical protein VHP34_11390 [Alphaproteobacteria bacterium]|nr:hypothetical protein [Alphaproteobacteria bacterium]
MGKLTDQQLKIAEQILVAGKCSLSNDSSEDYMTAASFVFDNGCFFHREASLYAIRAALSPENGGENHG